MPAATRWVGRIGNGRWMSSEEAYDKREFSPIRGPKLEFTGPGPCNHLKTVELSGIEPLTS